MIYDRMVEHTVETDNRRGAEQYIMYSSSGFITKERGILYSLEVFIQRGEYE